MRQHTPETTCPILPYTVKTVQRLYDDSAEYYIYLITVAAPDDSTTYYKTTRDVKTTFTAIHDNNNNFNNFNNNNNFRVSNIRVSNRTLIYNVCPKSALT